MADMRAGEKRLRKGRRSMKKIIIAVVLILLVLLMVKPDLGNSIMEQMGLGTTYVEVSGTEEPD